ncbi:PQQ-like beta-propeller repeat protein [Acidobacteria bacterium AH-259-O06]|nr:PQQ-like beta-propeller repeat protein [Acidobacteria bacterium AH-259-O06]
MRFRLFFALLIALVLTGAAVGAMAAPDWPQWRGPDRTGVSQETGLLQEWPAGGPPVVWSITGLGKGYGTVAIQRDHIFVQGTKGKDSVVFCLNRADGKILWSSALGTNLEQSRGGGPRGTPTVDGERVYILTENGDLACLQTRDSSVVWHRNILRDFKGRNPNWLVSESPLIDGNHVIVTPGGPNASVVALDKMSGKTVWTSQELSDRAAYSSCLVADVQGVRTVLAFTASAAVGLRATDGKLMWRYRPVANRTANVTTPIFRNDKVFFTSAYGTGCALLALKAQGNEVKAEEIYFSRDMQNHHGGVVLVDGYVYGFSNRILTCMDFETGKRVWRARSVGKGSLTCADGRLYLLSENNVVGLAEATPEGYREKGRFMIQDQGWPSWAHPVVSGGKLYIRNQGRLTSYNIKAD